MWKKCVKWSHNFGITLIKLNYNKKYFKITLPLDYNVLALSCSMNDGLTNYTMSGADWIFTQSFIWPVSKSRLFTFNLGLCPHLFQQELVLNGKLRTKLELKNSELCLFPVASDKEFWSKFYCGVFTLNSVVLGPREIMFWHCHCSCCWSVWMLHWGNVHELHYTLPLYKRESQSLFKFNWIANQWFNYESKYIAPCATEIVTELIVLICQHIAVQAYDNVHNK